MAEVWTPPAFDDVSTSELVTAAQLNALGNSHRFLKQIDYTEQASDVTVTATTVGTAQTLVSSSAFTYEASPIRIEFDCPAVSSINAVVNIILRDSTTVLGTLRQLPTSSLNNGISLSRQFTPTAASHTYNIAAWNESADTVVFEAGSGGTTGNATTFFPMSIRITRVPT